MHSFTKIEYHFGNGQQALGKVCPCPGKRDMDGASSSQRILTIQERFLRPFTHSQAEDNFLLVGHMCFWRGPLQVQPVVKLAYVDLLAVRLVPWKRHRNRK